MASPDSIDKNLHKNLCKLIKEMLRDDPAKGMGKPEPLKHNLSGLWSRRIYQKDRLIYKFDAQYIFIFAIGGHHDQCIIEAIEDEGLYRSMMEVQEETPLSFQEALAELEQE